MFIYIKLVNRRCENFFDNFLFSLLAKRCFPAPNTTTSRGITVTKKIFPGHTSSLVFFLISIIAFGALILGLIVACWRHRRTFQEHIKPGNMHALHYRKYCCDCWDDLLKTITDAKLNT